MDLRDAFFYELLKRAREDENIILLTADMGAFALNEFKNLVPNQFYNVGISEQNMVSVASGLAHKGKRVYCYTIASFLVLRALEQIKIDVCNMNRNITLVGVGAGMDYSYDGSTHHCPNDIGILRTLPNLKIMAPFDVETVRDSVHIPGPCYVRLPKGNADTLGKIEITDGFYMIRPGKHYIVTYGMMVHKMLEFINNNELKDVGLFAVSQLKPQANIIHFGPLLRTWGERGKIIVVEPHTSTGGLISVIGDEEAKQRVTHVSFADEFIDIGGSLDYVEEYAGIDYNFILKVLK